MSKCLSALAVLLALAGTAHAADRKAAIGPVQRHHHVVTLVGDGRPRHVLERDDRLLDRLVEPVPDDLERDRVDRAAHWRTFKNEIRDRPRFSARQ